MSFAPNLFPFRLGLGEVLRLQTISRGEGLFRALRQGAQGAEVTGVKPDARPRRAGFAAAGLWRAGSASDLSKTPRSLTLPARRDLYVNSRRRRARRVNGVNGRRRRFDRWIPSERQGRLPKLG